MGEAKRDEYAPARAHLFFINPVSFKNKEAIGAFVTSLDRVFAGMKGHKYSAVVSRFPRDAYGAVRRFVESRERDGEGARVYAVGGDGILFDCVNAAADFKNAEFGSIPYGGRSNFLRSFGEGALPLFRNVGNVVISPSLYTDLIRVGSNFALNYAALGLESYAQSRAAAIRDVMPKWFNGARAAGEALYPLLCMGSAFNKKMVNQRYSIKLDGTDYSGNYCSISAANGSCYGGRRYVCVSAVPNDGLINVTMYSSAPPLRLIRSICKIVQSNGLVTVMGRRECSKIAISSDRPLLISLDGEIFTESEFNAEVVPGAIRFIAPSHLTYERGSVH